MTTIARRTFRSSPHRDASETWRAIVELLTQGKPGQTRDELLDVTGIASSIIAGRAPKDAPIVVTCEGPRTRVYCVYDDDALEMSEGDEGSLGFDPLQGEWCVSLPCPEEDLPWVQRALQRRGRRIVARDAAESFSTEVFEKSGTAESFIIDPKGFLGS